MAIVVHGTVPNKLLYSTIVPIPKGKQGNASLSSQGTILSSIYGKLFDNIVLCCFGDSYSFISSELQFGFKVKTSTNLCSMVLKESWHIMLDIRVLFSVLDPTMAFNRIDYCKFFKLLVRLQVLVPIIAAID